MADRQHLPPDDGGRKPVTPPPKPSDARQSVTAATKLDDALADVESYIVNGGYETIFDGKERHTVLMDRRKALAALSEVKNVLRGDGHRV